MVLSFLLRTSLQALQRSFPCITQKYSSLYFWTLSHAVTLGGFLLPRVLQFFPAGFDWIFRFLAMSAFLGVLRFAPAWAAFSRGLSSICSSSSEYSSISCWDSWSDSKFTLSAMLEDSLGRTSCNTTLSSAIAQVTQQPDRLAYSPSDKTFFQVFWQQNEQCFSLLNANKTFKRRNNNKQILQVRKLLVAKKVARKMKSCPKDAEKLVERPS